jgi:NAD(P)-dependent dehydrogenase (short-subunit alcohol dehydrogenase family)
LVASATGKPNLSAVSRQAREILAQREARANIAAIEASGCAVRYAAVDVTDAKAIQALLREVRQEWGPITGVVHAAGILADKRLGDKTAEQFASVIRTKCDGAAALLTACADDPLEVLCFFSSVAAHSGNAGQSDYAAANAMLDHWAETERIARAPHSRVMSIAWGPWDGGMVTDSLARHFTARGVGLIPLGHGAKAMVEEIERGTHAQVIIGCGLDDGDVARPDTVHFDVARLPMVRDHAINGRVVLPMAMAVDTLLGSGRRIRGADVSLRDITLFQGVMMPSGTARLQVGLTAPDAAVTRVTLTHPSGRPAYQADVERSATTSPSVPVWPAPTGVMPAVCVAPYETALFHGPAFAVIREIISCDDTGITARLATATGMGWPTDWQLDPAAIDGALQLLIVWGVVQDGRGSLPTRIGSCEQWGAWPATDTVLCHVSAAREHGLRRRATATFLDETRSRVLARLTDIVMHAQDT